MSLKALTAFIMRGSFLASNSSTSSDMGIWNLYQEYTCQHLDMYMYKYVYMYMSASSLLSISMSMLCIYMCVYTCIDCMYTVHGKCIDKQDIGYETRIWLTYMYMTLYCMYGNFRFKGQVRVHGYKYTCIYM